MNEMWDDLSQSLAKELPNLTDEELGIHILALFVKNVTNRIGISPQEVTPEMIDDIRSASKKIDTDIVDFIPYEKAVKVAASGMWQAPEEFSAVL